MATKDGATGEQESNSAATAAAKKRLDDLQARHEADLARKAELKRWDEAEQRLQASRVAVSQPLDLSKPAEAAAKWDRHIAEFIGAAKKFEEMGIPEERLATYIETPRPYSRLRELAEQVAATDGMFGAQDGHVASVVLAAIDDPPSLTSILQHIVTMGNEVCSQFNSSLALLLSLANVEPSDTKPTPTNGRINSITLLSLVTQLTATISGHQARFRLMGATVDELAKMVLNSIADTAGAIIGELEAVRALYGRDSEANSPEASIVRVLWEIVDSVVATVLEMAEIRGDAKADERIIQIRAVATLVPFDGRILPNLKGAEVLLDQLAAEDRRRLAPPPWILTDSRSESLKTSGPAMTTNQGDEAVERSKVIPADGSTSNLVAVAEPTRPSTATPSERDTMKLLAAIGDSNAADIYRVATDPNLSADEKMRKILVIDRRFASKTSADWAEVVGGTDANIRQTPCWGELKPMRSAGPA